MPANVTPTVGSDGLLYSQSVPILSTEADLWGGTGAVQTDPIAVEYGAGIQATVIISVGGIITSNNTYVVLQMDLGDNNWIDINWCSTTISQGSVTFVFCNGIAGANTFQQSRQVGAVPSTASGSNQVVLGGRLRFIGKTVTAGGSSTVAGTGTPTNVSATIKYRLLPLS